MQGKKGNMEQPNNNFVFLPFRNICDQQPGK